MLKYREEPFPIVLHSCKSGQGGDNSFAAKLSSIIAQKIPQVAVIASPELVLCEMDNKGNYNEYVSDRSGSKHGNWLVFQNGDIAVAKISPCLENRKSVVFCNLPNGIGVDNN